MNTKNSFLFLAGCITMLLSILVVHSACERKGKSAIVQPSSAVQQDRIELSQPGERKQAKAQEESTVEEEIPLPPGEPLLN